MQRGRFRALQFLQHWPFIKQAPAPAYPVVTTTAESVTSTTSGAFFTSITKEEHGYCTSYLSYLSCSSERAHPCISRTLTGGQHRLFTAQPGAANDDVDAIALSSNTNEKDLQYKEHSGEVEFDSRRLFSRWQASIKPDRQGNVHCATEDKQQQAAPQVLAKSKEKLKSGKKKKPTNGVQNHNNTNVYTYRKGISVVDEGIVLDNNNPLWLRPAIIIDDARHPFRPQLLSPQAWSVLCALRSSGHETFIVGGTVRDIFLGKAFKDVDILTSAEPYKIKALFKTAFVVGRRFPVCHVHLNGSIIEVTSFSTNSNTEHIPLDASGDLHALLRQNGNVLRVGAGSGVGGKSEKKGFKKKKKTKQQQQLQHQQAGSGFEGFEEESMNELETGTATTNYSSNERERDTEIESTAFIEGPTWSHARRYNALRRDFTVNGLLLDPFSRIVYDYVGGIEDCTARILRTIDDPILSFQQDPARMLRGIRLASRTGLVFDKFTADALEALGPLISRQPTGRLQMELGAMLSHGAAAPAMTMLWKYGLLGLLLPYHNTYLTKRKVKLPPPPSSSSISSSTFLLPDDFLFDLLAELDRHIHPQTPADPALWMALLAAPLIAQECALSSYNNTHTSKIRTGRKEKLIKKKEIERGVESEIPNSTSVTYKQGKEGRAETPYDQQHESHPNHQITPFIKESTEDPTNTMLMNEEVGEDNKTGPSEAYLRAYVRIVHSVMERLTSPADKQTQRSVLTQLKKKTRKRKIKFSNTSQLSSSNSATSYLDGGLEVPSPILSRISAERAATLLVLEAELRGRDLDPSLKKVRLKEGRKFLGEEERMILQILRKPELDWIQRTALPGLS